jgi:hypothetical protein
MDGWLFAGRHDTMYYYTHVVYEDRTAGFTGQFLDPLAISESRLYNVYFIPSKPNLCPSFLPRNSSRGGTIAFGNSNRNLEIV